MSPAVVPEGQPGAIIGLFVCLVEAGCLLVWLSVCCVGVLSSILICRSESEALLGCFVAAPKKTISTHSGEERKSINLSINILFQLLCEEIENGHFLLDQINLQHR